MRPELFHLQAAVADGHWWYVARRSIVRQLADQLVPPRPGRLVLDVGCGPGTTLAGFAEGPDAWQCVGTDTSPDAIALAQARVPSATFVRGRAPDAVLSSVQTADLVLLMDVIEHVADDFRLVSELLAVMAPGAQLLLTVPAHEALWSEHDVTGGHYRRYDRARLAAVWHGLAVRQRLLTYFNARLYPLVKAARTVAQLRGKATGQHGSDIALPPAPVNRLFASLFAGEYPRVASALDQRNGAGYRTGVSLIAVLERQPGPIEPRGRDGWVPPDCHAPAMG